MFCQNILSSSKHETKINSLKMQVLMAGVVLGEGDSERER